MAFFDAAVDRYLADIAQFVILGAGFDTRAFRLPKDTRGRSFDVDAPKTQAVKREMLEESQALHWRYARAMTSAGGALAPQGAIATRFIAVATSPFGSSRATSISSVRPRTASTERP